MLSRTSRLLTYLTAILYALVGAILFFFPGQVAPLFAWKVTPFMAMTIGAWGLGNAWLAWISAYRWKWQQVYTALIYLWAFGLMELGVIFAFRDKLVLSHPVAWIYMLAILTNAITAVVSIIDWLRIRPIQEPAVQRIGWLGRISTIAFILFVGFLGVYGMTAPVGAPGTNGGIFPEVMSLFTLRSFAAFYLCLTLGVIPLLTETHLPTFLHHSLASYGLVVFITMAAFVYLRVFDLVNRPGGLVYFGAYLIVAVPLLFVFAFRGIGTGNA